MKRATIVQKVWAIGVTGLFFLIGCGGITPVLPSPASTASSGPLDISVTVTPSVVGMRQGATWNFANTVSGSSNAAVTWSIQEHSAGGAITSAGVYTAPATEGTYHLVATSVADPTKSAVAIVNVLKSGFTSTGTLGNARLQHTATLLPGGKVLVAGGGYGPDLIDGYNVVDQAELFDPAIGSFSPAGILSRDGHTATLLLDGDVLFTGGEIGWSNLSPIVSSTADLEKAISGLFESTGSMALAREAHAATLLSDGRVLVSGGIIPSGISWQGLREAEVYDPTSGTFGTVANMNVARGGHTATLLPNGNVLVEGGGYPTAVSSAELFDPVTGSFTPTGSMTVARSAHTATLLTNGKVLIAGGGTAELYDPSTGISTPTGNMAISRMWHTATLLPDGTVLIAGGLNGGLTGTETATTEIYDPTTGSFTAGATMRQGRFSHTATLLPDGSVLFIGGASSAGDKINVLSSAEIYN
jgi:Kelch motif/Galactose oxidase, central domain